MFPTYLCALRTFGSFQKPDAGSSSGGESVFGSNTGRGLVARNEWLTTLIGKITTPKDSTV